MRALKTYSTFSDFCCACCGLFDKRLEGIPLIRYYTALSVLLKAALKAATHFSLSKPMLIS